MSDPYTENKDDQPGNNRGRFSHSWWLWRPADRVGQKRHLSPLVLRILAVNVLALAILVGSLLFLGRYQDRIVATELDSLLLQSRIITSAVAENAIVIDESDDSDLLGIDHTVRVDLRYHRRSLSDP